MRDRLDPVPALRQRTLFVRLLRPVPTTSGGDSALEPANVVIDGGERIATVPVEWVAAADRLPPDADPALVDDIDDLPRTLVIRTGSSGDFSRYTLRLRAGGGSDQPPDGFDPRLSEIEFSFKVECPSDFDCAATAACPPQPAVKRDIDYLAKDYPGFRRLMLDRLSLLAPGWTERSAADLGVALVELLAYVADNLSYRQDAIANEAYLGTARRRMSVRRHARLVDYALHDGCNARAWVHVAVSADQHLPKRTEMLTKSGDLPLRLEPDSKDRRDALAAGAIVFETAHGIDLHPDLNRLPFYTWGDAGCCLPRGATTATLLGDHPALRAGDVLVLQEVVSPTTFDRKDADRMKRWAVRLTAVRATNDPSGYLFHQTPGNGPLPLTEIAWTQADALPFPLCLSAKERPELEISVALGNIVLVDHGRTVSEDLGLVPSPRLKRVTVPENTQPCTRPSEPSCTHVQREPVPVRFRPVLADAPLTQGFDLERELAVAVQDEDWRAASALIGRDPHDALPAIALQESWPNATPAEWTPQRDLLGSGAGATHFVVETDDSGRGVVRFGDDVHGQRPNAGTIGSPHRFAATYRVGNGTDGNVGAATIAHVVSNVSGVFTEITNPMPAAGAVEPEDIEEARRDAPEAFRTQERAVTAADYAHAAERREEVQRAAATFRWTGSWHTVFVTADRFGGAEVYAAFERRLRRHLERFRMAGYDLEVDGPRYVPLEVGLHVCVKSGYFRSEVLRAVATELGSGVLPDGRLGLFHPDNFSFGQPVYLSPIVAAAQAVAGVEAVAVRTFQRMAAPDPAALENGFIPMGRLEIAQLANSANFRERGRLTLSAGGGK